MSAPGGKRKFNSEQLKRNPTGLGGCLSSTYCVEKVRGFKVQKFRSAPTRNLGRSTGLTLGLIQSREGK